MKKDFSLILGISLLLLSSILIFYELTYMNDEIEYNEELKVEYIYTPAAYQEELVLPEIESYTYDFEKLKEENKDIKGWLYIPDTIVNYPVVQGQDNKYYLKHLFNGKYSDLGTLFFDYRTTENSKNNVIFGHSFVEYNLKHTMFSELNKYYDNEYFQSNKYLYYTNTDNETHKYEIFAVVYFENMELINWNFLKRDFKDIKEFNEWIKYPLEHNIIESDLVPDLSDKIITLSTCDRRFEEVYGRTLIMAKRIYN